MTTVGTSRAVARIDLGAVTANIQTLRRLAGVPVMAVVKADGYGHGAVPVARAAKIGGADWLGVCFLDEALELRDAGLTGPIVAWLLSPADDLAAAIDRDIDLSVGSLEMLEAVAAAAEPAPGRVRLHLELDTGLNRAGCAPADWPRFFARATELADRVEIVSIWSHLACADEPQHPANAAQLAEFQRGCAAAEAAGLKDFLRHLANSAAAIGLPDFRFDLVRCGIATYGVTPGGDVAAAVAIGLQPAMTVTAEVAQVRRLQPGDGVSYSHRWVADRETTVGLIPLGYADGVPRAATNRGVVFYQGIQLPIVGTVCMDQFVVDFGDLHVNAGDEVVLFGDGAASAHEWSALSGSIGYELVTRWGGRVRRDYRDGAK